MGIHYSTSQESPPYRDFFILEAFLTDMSFQYRYIYMKLRNLISSSCKTIFDESENLET